MNSYVEFWLNLLEENPKNNIVKMRRLTEGVMWAIEKAGQKDGMRTDELLAGLTLGIVTSFEAVSPKNRKNMVEKLCCFLHEASELLETGKKENTNNKQEQKNE